MKRCLQLLLCLLVIVLASFKPAELTTATSSVKENLSVSSFSKLDYSVTVHHSWEDLGPNAEVPSLNDYELTIWVTGESGIPGPVPVDGCLYLDIGPFTAISRCMSAGQTYATYAFTSGDPMRSEAFGTSVTEYNGYQIYFDVHPTYINY